MTQITPPPPPPPLQLGQQAFGTHAVAINEKLNVLFNGVVDRLNPLIGFNYTTSIAAPTFLSASVSSHIIHFDDTNAGNPRFHVIGRVTFNSPIIALMYHDVRVDQSDAQLGNIGTTIYPFGVGNRALPPPTPDWNLARLLNPFTVRVTLGAAIDQIRVLTLPVPAPGTAALLPLARLAAARLRRNA
ncbi:MAG: hypothetical protein KJZ65_10330 [Phycisphaerales bacterium]|nr:hypothetical protein [Phycisphaerales bacterium]